MKLQEAIQLCRDLNAYLSNRGHHVALTGGVLFNGESTKDVDIIVYPRKANGIDQVEEVINLLIKYGWQFNEDRTPHHYGDTKIVLQFQSGTQIIDVFCLQ